MHGFWMAARSRLGRYAWRWMIWPLALAGCMLAMPAAMAVTLPASHRVDINLGAQPWRYLKDTDPLGAQSIGFDDSSWQVVGLPYSADQFDTFINEQSGGGQGELSGRVNWYRTVLTHTADYVGKKVMVEFEGAHTGVQVYINGHLIQGTSEINPQATHVVGFVPFIVDLTPYLRYDGKDVLAVKVARDGDNGDGSSFFEDPGFSGAFRFGQSMSGIFRPVRMFVTDKVYIPANVYSGQHTWGTYVATKSISADQQQAQVEVQTNVANESGAAQHVTLTTQIVDADGQVVASQQTEKTLAPGVPSSATPVFDQTLTVDHPTLWYPNNSVWGKPYMYKVLHTVSIDGVVVDSVSSPLGIRLITWDKDFPYVNGHKMHLWGASGRYDYPALGASVPAEQKWRDMKLLAASGGNLYRPGHSPSSPELVAAADAYGIFIVQPSGDGENGFANACSSGADDFQACQDRVTLKKELHRDIIIRDRSHPSILAWEANNGVMNTPLAQQLKAISEQWDPVHTRAQADRTPNDQNGDILSCSKAGCETFLHHTQFPDKPAWGAEYWGLGGTRGAWNTQLAYALSYLHPWAQARAVNTFGMSQWYFADSPGEIIDYVDGVHADQVRSIGSSMVDFNRFPRLLYYIYQANWIPYSIKPVVTLANTWNRSPGQVRVNAFSNCPAVRLLLNGQQVGDEQTPNPWNIDNSDDYDLVNNRPADVDSDAQAWAQWQANVAKAQQTTRLPAQVHWDLDWQPGTLTAQCVDPAKPGQVLASDTQTTAGKADHIVLKVVADVVRPDGTSFQLTDNGSDAAFVVAEVVDADGHLVPDADQDVTFTVTGPATYQGGTEQLVTPGEPLDYHAPGDHELQFESGLTKIALRTQFATGTVTVSAVSPGLKGATTSFKVSAVPAPPTPDGPPSIIAQPVTDSVTEGQPAHFSVTASGAAPLSFQWLRNGAVISGAVSASLDTVPATLADDGAIYSVRVSNDKGEATSADATLHVVPPAAVVIQKQPQAQNVDAGQSAHFSVQASGSPTLSYQWRRNGAAIANATGADYDTGVLGTDDNAARYSVVIGNPVNQVVSDVAVLTVNPARPPVIAQQPASVVINPGQPATFSVKADGSSPFHYAWSKDGHSIGDDADTLSIQNVGPGDAGNYTVAVSNQAGKVVSQVATLKLAPPGANLALNKPVSASSVENPQGTAARFAVDGKLDTRWGSAFEDPSSITVDLGSVRTFNRVVLNWENAYASQYQIEYSTDGKDFEPATQVIDGKGGVADLSFPAVQGRYVRMQGLQRATQYGYSLYEFGVYDGAACGSGERYSVLGDNSVRDNLSQLTWARLPHTFTDQGAQFTQPVAAQYCQSQHMRLPTRAEALAISGADAATCAYPVQWSTWTSDAVPGDEGFAYLVSSNGKATPQVADNAPGAALCVSGDTVSPPQIGTQPAAQTAGVGRSAHFEVAASGVGPLSYEWFRTAPGADASATGSSVYVSNDPGYDTPALSTDDNGATYRVQVTSAQGLTVASDSVTLTVDHSDAGNPPPDNGDTGDGGDGDTGQPPPGGGDNSPGDGAGGTNLALHRPVTESGSENDGYLGAAMAVDGDFTTRWSSAFEDPQWIAVDLGARKAFNHVVLRWERAYSTQYVLQSSDDGEHWRTFYDSVTGQTGHGGTERITFDNQVARYVRLYSTARATEYGNSLFEFEVYATPAPSVLTQPLDQSVTQGQAATFSVSVQAATALSYQWRRNGTPIQGATDASYTFTPGLDDSGTVYDVVVTDANGLSVTSAKATLTVSAALPPAPPPGGGQGGNGAGDNGDGSGSAPGQGSTGDPESSNLAYRRPVKVSGVENPIAYKGDNVNDGDFNTRWSSAFADPQWVEIDLGSARAFNRVVLDWQDAYGVAYTLQVSSDEKQWTTVYTQDHGKGGIETDTFPTATARYVRMLGTQRNTQYGYSLWEFEVYDDAGQDSGSGSGNGADPGNGSDDGSGSQPPDYTVDPNGIGTVLENHTHGAYTDQQIYVEILGNDADGKLSWLDADGTVHAASAADNEAPDHLSKDGQDYANYAFTLDQARHLVLPKMSSGRIFVSLGSPMYIKILRDANGNVGFAGPNPQNPTDPNNDIAFDWYEFTYGDNGLWINTTQVDEFGLPLTLEVWGDDKTFHMQTGITQTHAQILDEYDQAVPAQFRQPLQGDTLRIMAPAKASFAQGQAHAHYFDDYIDEVWTYYATHALSVDMWGGSRRFVGQVKNGQMVFNEVDLGNGAYVGGTYVVDRPSTQDVFLGAGTLAAGNDVEKALEAQICAAFNRHVMENVALWNEPSAWYQAAPANYYAKFWHDHSVGGLAYGFPYDDVDDQSSVIIDAKPEHMVLGIGW